MSDNNRILRSVPITLSSLLRRTWTLPNPSPSFLLMYAARGLTFQRQFSGCHHNLSFYFSEERRPFNVNEKMAKRRRSLLHWKCQRRGVYCISQFSKVLSAPWQQIPTTPFISFDYLYDFLYFVITNIFVLLCFRCVMTSYNLSKNAPFFCIRQ